MQWSRWFIAGVSGGALILASSIAYGQTSAQKAEELFNKALELSDARKYAEACPLLAESQKLDPTPGTLFALADCEVEANKYASAVIHFKEYLRQYDEMKADVRKKHDQRANVARSQIKKYEPQVSIMTLSFPGGVPSGIQIKQDGEEFQLSSIDIPVPVDPGEHVLLVKMPGRDDFIQRYDVAAGGKAVVVFTPPVSGDSSESGDSSGGKTSKRTVIAVGFLGAGVAALAVGGATGGFAVQEKGIVDAQCRGLDCSQSGYDAAIRGRAFGNLSTIGLAAGAGLVAGGVALLLTAPKAKTQSGLVTRFGASAGLGSAFLGVEGQF